MLAVNRCLGDGVRWVGDPVDVVTGALVEVVVELVVAGPLPIVWERHYSTARLDMAGSLGWGQTHGHDRRLYAGVDGWVAEQPDGGSLLFPYDALERPQAGWRLSTIHSERHLRGPDGTVHVFRAGPKEPMRPQQILRGGEALTLAYDREKRLVEIADRGRARVVRLEHQDERIAALVLLAHPSREPGRPLTLMRYEYDARGDLVAATDRYGYRRTFDYDAGHRMIARTDRARYRFEYAYDGDGRCVASRGHDGVQAVALRYMPEAQATAVRRADGGEWLHRYDASGSITEILDPYGGSRRFEYDEDGLLVAEIDAGGNRRAAVHDEAGAVTAWVNAAGGVRPADDATGPPAHRIPGSAAELEFGDLSAEILALAPVASPGLAPVRTAGASIFTELFTERDPRVESTCRRDEQGLLSAEERVGAPPRRWAYTPNGWVRSHVDHDGGRHEFEYASWNHRVIARDPLDRELRYEYTTGEELSAVVDPAGNRHEYRYDLRGLLTEVRHAGAVVETYAYDRAGDLVSKRDASGQTLVEYQYGREHLKARRRLAGGEQHRYEYAANGRFARVDDGGRSLEFEYSAGGRRSRDHRDGRGVEHVFDGERLTETRVLERFVTRYRRLDEKTLEIEDPLGNRHAIVLEPDGVVVRRMACGARETVQFDSLGRCLGKHLFAVEMDPPVWRRRFEYSPEGDLVRVEDSERGTTEHRHDAAHQLAEVIAANGQRAAYRYDAAGNLLSAPHLGGVTVAPGNRVVEANGGTLEYDLRNNVSVWRRGGRELRFHRDALDRLRRMDGLDAPWSADYDPLGRRTRKTHGAEVTEYYWDSDRLAAESRNDGLVRVYVYADDFSLTPWLVIDYASPDADPASGTLHYLVGDQRGAPVAALDAAGRRTWTARLEPYGLAEIDASGDLSSRPSGPEFTLSLRLAGQFCDAETGLHYHRFRYYSPELGRYLEEDPAGTGGGINLYAYTNNPLVELDPRGRKCKESKSEDGKEDGDDTKKPLHERKGDVDGYGELKKTTGDGSCDRDHIPSKAALKEAARNYAEENGIHLTDEQWKNVDKRLEKEGTAVVVPKDVHKAGPTHSGKNTPEVISGDATDLSGAAARDADAMVKNAETMDPDNVDAYKKAADEIKSKSNQDYNDHFDKVIKEERSPP